MAKRRLKVDIPIEIGVFAKAKDGEEQDEPPLYLAKMLVKDGDSTITLTVDGKPYEAASIRSTNWSIACPTTTARR